MSLPIGATDAVPVGGGDINEAWRVRMADGRVAFVKSRPRPAVGEYEREAFGLRWLAEPGALQVPAVLEVAPGHLALQWVERGSLSSAGAEELGSGLALTHAAGAEAFGGPGERSATIGSLALPNEPLEDWSAFYAHRRLLPALEAAKRRGSIGAAGAAAVERLCGRIDELAPPAERPARLHGDLWSGNVLADIDGRPWLIDPTAYGGHREVDLAMLRLFGSPSERIFAAYEDVSPLAEGWQDRVRLWQLLPLLVHAALFGRSYGEQAAAVARHYAG